MARAVIPKGYETAYETLRFAPGVVSNGHVFLTGMTGSGPDGQMPEDPETQFQQAFEKIAGVLAEAGVDFASVVELTSYHVGLRAHFDVFDAVRKRFVRPPYPAWTAVEVAGLRRPGALVEVKAIARMHPTGQETP